MYSVGNCFYMPVCILPHTHMWNQEKKRTDAMKDKLYCLKPMKFSAEMAPTQRCCPGVPQCLSSPRPRWALHIRHVLTIQNWIAAALLVSCHSHVLPPSHKCWLSVLLHCLHVHACLFNGHSSGVLTDGACYGIGSVDTVMKRHA